LFEARHRLRGGQRIWRFRLSPVRAPSSTETYEPEESLSIITILIIIILVLLVIYVARRAL